MEVYKNRQGKEVLKLSDVKDKIIAFQLGQLEETDLSESEKRQYKRWVSIRNLALTEFSPLQTVKAHLELMKEDGQEISERTAWNDYRNAMELWGESAKISYRSKLVMYEEFLLQAFKIAFEEKDSKALSSLAKGLIELASKIREFDDTNIDDNQNYTFVLSMKFNNEEKPVIIDLDDYQEMPSKEIENAVLEAADNHHMSEIEFKKMLKSESE